jgi:hypothetical protein
MYSKPCTNMILHRQTLCEHDVRCSSHNIQCTHKYRATYSPQKKYIYTICILPTTIEAPQTSFYGGRLLSDCKRWIHEPLRRKPCSPKMPAKPPPLAFPKLETEMTTLKTTFCGTSWTVLWRCHCGHENGLTRIKSMHPFEHVVCGTCNHKFCDRCDATEVLTKGPIKPTEVFSRRFLFSSNVNL